MLKISQDEMRLNVRWKEISYVMQGSMSVLNPVRKVIKTFEDIVETHQQINDRKAFLDEIKEHINRWGFRQRCWTHIRTNFPAECASVWQLRWRPSSIPR